MKKLYLLSALLFLALFSAQAEGIRAHINFSTFNIPGESPYIETYMMVEGNGATFIKNKNNKYQATIEVLVLFKQGDKIIEFNKYEFNSPELTDTLSNVHRIINFMDQQRYMLPNGEYIMEYEVSDKHTDKKPLKTSQKIAINYNDKEVMISDIMLVDSYSEATEITMLTRGGYNIIPGVFNFYPDTRNELIFFAEIYNTDKVLGADAQYVVSTFVENKESGMRMENLASMNKKTAQSASMILKKFDLANIPSGNFNIVVEVRNRNNELITSQKKLIQRSNPRRDIVVDGVNSFSTESSFVQNTTTLDSLREAARSLIPRSSNSEAMFIKHKAPTTDRESLERFFVEFWIQRAGSNAAYEWNEYYKLVQHAQKKFSNGKNRGYETARGYYICKYGQPDHVVGNVLNSTIYPYQIWHYYDIGSQRDVKFVFYSHDIATNTYELLHSNCHEEVQNPHWLERLYRWPTKGDSNYDNEFGENMQYYGNQIMDEYNSPY